MSKTTTKKNIPVLRFPEFQDDLTSTALSKLTKKTISYGIVQAGPHVPGGMPYIKSQDLNQKLEIPLLERTSDEIARKYKRSEVSPGDIVFSLRGNIGISKIVPPSILVANLTQGTARISVTDQFSNEYVFFNLQTEQVIKRILAVSKGSTFREISLLDLRQILIVHPQLKEQQKIAAFLGAVDAKLDALRRKRELLAEYKHGVMQKLFSQEIRFTQDDGQPFPDWEFKKLGNITKPIKRTASEPNIPIMTISAGTGFMSQKERFSQVIAGSSLEKYTLIRKNEFAYNRGASKAFPYGCIYLMKSHDKALIPFVYRTFRLTEGVSHFYAQFFLTGRLDRQLRRIISSSARMDGLLNISEKDFYKADVPVPCKNEQQKIADFLTAIDNKITAVDQQIGQMETFKKGLLQQMFV